MKEDEKDAYRHQLSAAALPLGQLAEAEKKPELARKEYDEAVRLAEQNSRVDEKNDLRQIELMLCSPTSARSTAPWRSPTGWPPGRRLTPSWRSTSPRPTPSPPELPPDKAERAQTLLVKAVEATAGQSGPDSATGHARLPADLDPLRDREDFQALVRQIPPPG